MEYQGWSRISIGGSQEGAGTSCPMWSQFGSPSTTSSSFHCHSLICANLDLPRSCGCLQEVEIEGDGVAALAQRDIPSYIYSPSYVPKVPDVNVKTDTETYLEDGDHYMCWPVLYPQITGGDRLPGEIFVFHF